MTVVNTSTTRTFTFTAKTSNKTWTFSVPPGTNTTRTVPSQYGLAYVADPTDPTDLSQSGFTLQVQ